LDLIDISRFTISGAGNIYLSNEIKEKLITFQKKSNNYRFISPRKKIDISKINNSFLLEKKISPYLREQYINPYKSFKEIINEKVELLILNSDTYLKYLNNPVPAQDNPMREIFLNRKNFYSTIFKSLPPVIEINPKFNHPGPILKLYKLRE
jgi:hypothetical protein